MGNKDKLIEQLVAQLPEDKRIDVNSAKIAWFCNIRPRGGFRLTTLGYQTLKEVIKLEHYVYEIKDPLIITPKTMLKLDRKLQYPFFIVAARKVPTHIVFFSSKEAVWINLYGDLDKFLDNYN